MKNAVYPDFSLPANFQRQSSPLIPVKPVSAFPFRGGIGLPATPPISVESLRPSSLPDNDQKIDQSIAYMTGHLNEPLNIAKLASVANISSSHFFVVFKRRTGKAPIDYFIHLRMTHARRLLEQTGMSVKDIASTLGYDDPFYFSRLFKSVNKLAPTDYRARKQLTLVAA